MKTEWRKECDQEGRLRGRQRYRLHRQRQGITEVQRKRDKLQKTCHILWKFFIESERKTEIEKDEERKTKRKMERLKDRKINK